MAELNEALRDSSSLRLAELNEALRDSSSLRLAELNKALFVLLEKDKQTPAAIEIATAIESILTGGATADTVIISDSYYILGHFYLDKKNYTRASENFSISAALREALGLADRRYALGLTNNSVALLQAGDYSRAYAQGLKGLEARRAVSGMTPPHLLPITLISPASALR
ncbi:MAG: hypothetical protein U5L72_11320 [Bacteroidales bacterium]|nr:hypothetical protein [Bacteroidales bacterium]